MIHESYPWKRELSRDADMIERWCAKPPSERQTVLLERKTFYAAYAVRKLMESNKLSDQLRTSKIPAIEYPKKAKPVVRFRHLDEIDDLYNFDAGADCELNLKSFVDTIIHSVYFTLEVSDDDKSVIGFFVTSDHRDKKLWCIKYGDYADLMRGVANNYPAEIRIWFDENDKEQRTQS